MVAEQEAKVSELLKKLEDCKVRSLPCSSERNSLPSQGALEPLNEQVKDAKTEMDAFEATKAPLLAARDNLKKKLSGQNGILRQTEVGHSCSFLLIKADV